MSFFAFDPCARVKNRAREITPPILFLCTAHRRHIVSCAAMSKRGNSPLIAITHSKYPLPVLLYAYSFEF